MFRDKSPDIEDIDHESNERLLAEEEGHLWTGDDETEACNSFATGVLQITTLAIFFFIWTLFGFLWHGDLDSQCSRHVSQYCEQALYSYLLPRLVNRSMQLR